jgi:outer membrane protein TolC
VSLQGCLLAALVENYEVQIARIEPLRSAEDVTAARAEFDPTVTLSASQENKKEPTSDSLVATIPPSGVATNKEDVSTVSAAVSSRLMTGGVASLEYTFMGTTQPTFPFTTLDPRYDTSTFIRLTHPLLKGVGLGVNRTQIKVALSAKRARESDVETAMISTAFETTRAYWDLVRAREAYRASLASLKRAKDFRNLVRERIDAGALAPKEIYDAEAQVAAEEDAVEGSRTDVRNTEETLKRAMNLKGQEGILGRMRLLPVDRPALTEEPMNMPALEARALALRPDLRSVKEGRVQTELERRLAWNQRLPELNVEAHYGQLGLGADFGDSMERMVDANYKQYGVGVEFAWPILNRGPRARYRQSIHTKRQASLRVEDLEQGIVLEVRTSVRGVERTAHRVKATRAIQKARQEALDAMIDRFNAGKATSFDVVQSLERLALADRDVQNALADYRIALSTLHRAVGDLLEWQGLNVEGEGEGGQ